VLRVGSATSSTSSTTNGNTQNITAGVAGQNGGITLTGPAADNTSVYLIGNLGTQTVSTTGALNLTAGTAPVNGFGTIIINIGAGLQHIRANSTSLTGGTSGTNNGVFIFTNSSLSTAKQ
jgi:hypothetical protein